MGFETGWLAKVTLEARFGHDSVVNTVHYNYDDVAVERNASLQALADRINVDVVPAFKALFRTYFQIQPVVVTEEKDPLNPDAVREAKTAGSGGAGTRGAPTGDELPLAMCRVYKLTTGKVGRSFRGRIFVGGVPFETDHAGGIWNPSSAGNFAALADTFVNSFPMQPDLIVGPTLASVNWVVYSPTRRARNQDDYANKVTAKVARTEVHWLRSRAMFG